MAFARLDDIVVHHAETGPADAPLLVLVNSLGTDLRVWDALMPRLAKRFRLLRYDKRGHGLTDATPGPYQMALLAQDLARLLDARQERGVIVCGLSIGGMIAQALASGAWDGDRDTLDSPPRTRSGRPWRPTRPPAPASTVRHSTAAPTTSAARRWSARRSSWSTTICCCRRWATGCCPSWTTACWCSTMAHF